MNLQESVSSSDAPTEEVEGNEDIDTENKEQGQGISGETGSPSDETETENEGQADEETGAESDAGQADGADASTDESGTGDSDIHIDTDLLSDLIKQGTKSETYQIAVVEKLDSIEMQIACGNFIMCVIAGILIGKLILGRLK